MDKLREFNNKLARAFVKSGGVPNFDVREFLELWLKLEKEYGLEKNEKTKVVENG